MSPRNHNDPQARAAADELGKWLKRFDWTHWIHLSFRKSVSPDIARNAFNAWLSSVQKKRRDESSKSINKVETVAWARAIEAGDNNGRIHVHALAHGPWRNRDLQTQWRWGDTKINRYDPDEDGAYYLAKVALDSEGLFDMSDELPPMRSDEDESATTDEAEAKPLDTDNRWLFTDEELAAQAAATWKPKTQTASGRSDQSGKLKQFATRLDESLFRDLRVAVAEDDQTITVVVNRAIRLWLRRRAKRNGQGRTNAQQS